MRVAWRDIGAVRRILQDLPSKFFKELEGLLSHMWPSVVLEKHYLIRELAPVLVLDGLFEPQQRVAIPLVQRARHCSRRVWGLLWDPPCTGPVARLIIRSGQTSSGGVTRKFGEGVPAQVSSSSSDCGSKLRGPSLNSPRVAAKRDVYLT
ncbi:hypothetical protein AVEN_265393-1 [Araneus ventricosus]|uniref:Uncharacterized protein n=1 Tax=Araneus ventricosus TaxID=182803 RepID=A0A4Y2HPW2_ARAVE|nr:hypothetical protein AVEN_265393-1 [Araneus ventricosus]